jgi:hypothetical protein
MPRKSVTSVNGPGDGVVLFRLRNVTVVGYFYYLILPNCYMFRRYDHLQAEIY